ncbi:hypothetical protein AAEJ74_16755 [Limnospira fusiformis PMC 851.14]|uniref:Uncharacterized protein n=1 Tax=Limnospira fusiformis PMC 851.14 TaxID=2219512 RepID=A0ABU9EMV3_LIMFS
MADCGTARAGFQAYLRELWLTAEPARAGLSKPDLWELWLTAEPDRGGFIKLTLGIMADYYQ